jgi:hypothetical protein
MIATIRLYSSKLYFSEHTLAKCALTIKCGYNYPCLEESSERSPGEKLRGIVTCRYYILVRAALSRDRTRVLLSAHIKRPAI